MKSFPILLLLFFVLWPALLSGETPNDKLARAIELAGKEKKDLMMILTGSSWSEKSKKFDQEIIGSEGFKAFTAEKYVTVVFELPLRYEDAHPDVFEIQKKYQFRQLPTIILTDQEGRPYAYTGVKEGGLEQYLEHLAELHSLRIERDRLLTQAGEKEDAQRVNLLVQALQSLPQMIVPIFYEAELQLIEKADPMGRDDYVPSIRRSQALTKEREGYNALFREKKYDEIFKKAKDEASKKTGEDAQRLLLYAIRSLADQEKYDEASALVKEMSKLDPQSELGKREERYLTMLNNAKERKNRPPKPTGPIVSKPVAVVTDLEELRKDAQQIAQDFKQSEVELVQVNQKAQTAALKIKNLETQLAKAREEVKSLGEEQKKAVAKREKLARKAKAMQEVIANHEAMEKRKQEASQREEKRNRAEVEGNEPGAKAPENKSQK
jgi:tetratricopeptide (TPR) repeat protein